MSVISFDDMLNGRFVCSLKYQYCPMFPITEDETYQDCAICPPRPFIHVAYLEKVRR